MTDERVEFRPITPMKQVNEAGCGPTSISMVLSGFGIEIGEQELIQRYFPSAGLPTTDLDAGVTEEAQVRGIVQIIEDLKLQSVLQVDIFDPYLDEFTKSKEDRWVIRTTPEAARKYIKDFYKDKEQRKWDDGGHIKGFYTALEELARQHRIGLYTGNLGMLRVKRAYTSWSGDHEYEGFYSELLEFVKQGHVIGPHGGMTRHIRVLDGVRSEEGCRIIDPRGEEYPISPSSLIWVDSGGFRGDLFDRLFRVSPREEILLHYDHLSSRSLLERLRSLAPLWRG